MMRHWGKLAMGLLVVAAVAVVLTRRHAPVEPLAASPTPAARVDVTAVRLERVPRTLELSGTLRPQRSAVVATRVSGLIIELPPEEGDRVAAGQAVARIDVGQVAARTGQARAEVSLAEASRGERAQAVTRAAAAIDAAAAHRRELLAQIEEARASSRQAAIDQRRQAYMFKHDAVARAELDRADTALSVAHAHVASLQAALSQADADAASARAALAQARASTASSAAAVDVARAGVDLAASDLAYGTLRAPFTGSVTRKLAHVGDLAVPGRPLLQIDDMDHLRLEVAAPEQALRYLVPGQSVKVSIEALRIAANGTVARIVPSADPATRTFTVKIALPPTPGLVPGLYGRVRVPQGYREIVRVPESALVRRGQLVGVFVAAEGQARLRWIRTGEGGEVLSGLRVGDRIVTRPAADLEDGASVTDHE